MKRIEIVACTDKKFVMPTGVMIFSVCKNNLKGGTNFHIIIDEGVSPDDKIKLEDIVKAYNNNIFFYQVDSAFFKKLPALGKFAHVSQATYYRLCMADILPQNIDRVLYLDGDIIVRDSLAPLWDINMEGYAIAAVPSQGESNEKTYKRLGYSSALGYFNAGVLLVNLDYWRRNNVINEFICFIQKYPERIILHDQDVLNCVFNNKKLRLPIKYNFQHGFLFVKPYYNWEKYKDEVEEARSNPVVVHYAGGKPWAHTTDRYPHPFRSLWFKYMSQTCWKDEPIWESRPLTFRIKKIAGNILRKLGLLSELPPNGTEYIDIAPIE